MYNINKRHLQLYKFIKKKIKEDNIYQPILTIH
jgi:hypothetical protein